MNTESVGDTLRVLGLGRLSGGNGLYFKETVKVRLTEEHRVVEVDCSNVSFIDSEGLGALVSIHKVLSLRQGRLRLVHLRPMVRQFLELVQLERIFEIAP